MSNPTFTFEEATVPVTPSAALEANPFVAPVNELKAAPINADGKPAARAFTVPGSKDRATNLALKSAYHQLMQAGKAADVTVKVHLVESVVTPAKGKTPAVLSTRVTFWTIKRITRNRTPKPATTA